MARRSKQSPAAHVIGLLGVRPLAAALGLDPAAVIRWRERNAGRIPSRHMSGILALARRRKIELTADDLIT